MKEKAVRKFFFWAVIIAVIFALKPFSNNIHARVNNHVKRLSPDLFSNITRAEMSLRKSANLIHFPFWFKKTNLPIYELYINANDTLKMNKSPLSATENGKKQTFVPTFFVSGDDRIEAQIRYRGAGEIHWTNGKRSLLVKFPKDNLFQKMQAIDLVVPEDRVFFIEMINNNRLKRLGLVPSNLFFVWVKINDGDAGVYLAKERYTQEWLEKNSVSPDSEVFSQTGAIENDVAGLDPKISGYALWRRDIHEKEIDSFTELETLFALLKKPDDEFNKNIGNILDLQKWYKAIAIGILAGGTHSLDANLNLLFNSATGKLEPLLEDIIIVDQKHDGDPIKAYNEFKIITQRILSNKNFYEDYKKVLRKAVADENLKADLVLYDNLYNSIKSDVYKDQTKYLNDQNWDSNVRTWRALITTNYEAAQKLAEAEALPIFENIENLKKEMADFSGKEFPNFYDISKTGKEFVKKHPQFLLSGKNLILKAGTYSFYENVIIPGGLKFIIEPGVNLFLDKNVSIVSYSPVKAIGTALKPITLKRLYPQNSWGSFAVINTNDASEFKYIKMSGGSSSEKINGVIFTGMLAVHNAPLYVYNSEFSADGDDDAINVKNTTGEIKQSKFFDTVGDAVDLDMTDGFVMENNEFYNIGIKNVGDGGDAIDISFSNALITGNKIEKCGDKGISVGEKSAPRLIKNTIQKCNVGVAVKDESETTAEDNTISDNNTGIALYQKKAVFGGGIITIKNNILKNNKTNITKDEASVVIEK